MERVKKIIKTNIYIYICICGDGFYENVSIVSIIKNRANTNNSQHIYYLKH